jgi:RNA polymerase sigma-70 factor (ECF subfamily)
LTERERQIRSSEEEFNLVFELHKTKIYNYVLGMVRNASEAEDLTQEIFVKVYRNLPTFRGDSELSPWLYRIAKNTCLDYFRQASHKREKRVQPLETTEACLPVCDQSGQTPEVLLGRSEMGECVHSYLDRLPENYRMVLVLHDFEGLKNREIAQRLNLSLDAVKVRLHRARKMLGAVFRKECVYYHTEDSFLCHGEALAETAVPPPDYLLERILKRIEETLEKPEEPIA